MLTLAANVGGHFEVTYEPVSAGIISGSNFSPTEFVLFQNYPNPFNPKTTISYQLPALSEVDLGIYNILGQKVATLVNKKQPPGRYKVMWDASSFASGLYFYILESSTGLVQTKKLILLR